MSGTHIGKSLYFATTLPATNDSAGYEALNWVEVKGLVQAPQFGLQSQAVDIPDLKSGFGRGVKGMGQGVDSQMSFYEVASDTTGQGAFKTLANSAGGICAIKVGQGSGTDNALDEGDPVQYAQGFVHSLQINQISGENYEGFTVNFRQNAPHVDATEPA